MKFLFVLLTCCINSFVYAQQLSIQLMPGLMNYGGDLQYAYYTFSQSTFCIGAAVNLQVNHFSINGAIVKGSVAANDKLSSSNAKRNLNFKSNITEASVTLQYDVIDITGDRKITPCFFAGIGLFHFSPYTDDVSGVKTYLQPLGTEGQGLAEYPNRKLYNLSNFSIPFGMAIKYKINKKFTVSIEYNSRLLNTDYLDDVSKTYPKQQALLNGRGAKAVELSFRTDEILPGAVYVDDKLRGNSGKSDNYYTSVIKLSYTIPAPAIRGRRGKGGDIRCPRKVY